MTSVEHRNSDCERTPRPCANESCRSANKLGRNLFADVGGRDITDVAVVSLEGLDGDNSRGAGAVTGAEEASLGFCIQDLEVENGRVLGPDDADRAARSCQLAAHANWTWWRSLQLTCKTSLDSDFRLRTVGCCRKRSHGLARSCPYISVAGPCSRVTLSRTGESCLRRSWLRLLHAHRNKPVGLFRDRARPPPLTRHRLG
jgi:hypothetical protein